MLAKMFKRGFTMIELLVVIAVIGILAVALLATLNPLEQIRKGRDTRTRSDVAQLTSAIERYNASLGYFPWQTGEGDDLVPAGVDIPFTAINGGGTIAGCSLPGAGACDIDNILGNLTSTSEVKSSFIDRIIDPGYSTINLYYDDENTGGSVYGCFTPESSTFQREAFDRCAAGGWGADFSAVAYGAGSPCPDGADETAYSTFDPTNADEMICLP